jgi:peptidoglycan/LPS O-acetylase OafA/YrhL
MGKPICASTSTYLDLCRGAAALAVVLFHFHDKSFGPDWLTQYFPSNGQAYVMIFFVISGFVIAMTAEKKELSDFAIDRIARIYAVAFPVTVICLLTAIAEPNINALSEYRGDPLSASLLSLAFLNQSWNLNVYPPLNGPYWSLAYEIFYYLIFSSFTYTTNPVFRCALALICCLIAGPKIVILLPCWLSGVAAYKWRNKIKLGLTTACLIAIAAPLMLVLAFHFGLKEWTNAMSWMILPMLRETPSESFLREWLVSLAFAINLWAACSIEIEFPRLIKRGAKLIAGMSFSIYLLHLPLLYFLVYVIGRRHDGIFIIISLPVVFLTCLAFSQLTERKTGSLRYLIERFLRRLHSSMPDHYHSTSD